MKKYIILSLLVFVCAFCGAQNADLRISSTHNELFMLYINDQPVTPSPVHSISLTGIPVNRMPQMDLTIVMTHPEKVTKTIRVPVYAGRNHYYLSYSYRTRNIKLQRTNRMIIADYAVSYVPPVPHGMTPPPPTPGQPAPPPAPGDPHGHGHGHGHGHDHHNGHNPNPPHQGYPGHPNGNHNGHNPNPPHQGNPGHPNGNQNGHNPNPPHPGNPGNPNGHDNGHNPNPPHQGNPGHPNGNQNGHNPNPPHQGNPGHPNGNQNGHNPHH